MQRRFCSADEVTRRSEPPEQPAASTARDTQSEPTENPGMTFIAGTRLAFASQPIVASTKQKPAAGGDIPRQGHSASRWRPSGTVQSQSLPSVDGVPGVLALTQVFRLT